MKDSSQPSKSVLFHSGKLFLVENTKKGREEYYLSCFLESEQGKQWLERYRVDVNSKISSESPDFIFTTQNGKKVGLELTQFVLKNTTNKKKSHAENIQALYRVGVKVVEYFQQTHNIPLSLFLEYYDKRKNYSTKEEYLAYCYNPTTPILDVNYNKLKDLIIQRIERVGIPTWGVNKEWISLGEHSFIVTFDRFYDPYTNVRVNSIGLSIEDPFIELQQEIDKKNHKYTSYLKQCDECHLLIISEGSETGNCVNFSKKIAEKRFKSFFPMVYLMDFGEFSKLYIRSLHIKRMYFLRLILTRMILFFRKLIRPLLNLNL